MNQPAVSIYIITYLDSEGRGRVLKNTCEWALKQRYPNFEVVVSDNGGSYSAADALISIKDSRLRICTNSDNAGFTGNMNRCVEHCRFSLIKPICDDDLIHPDFLAVTVPLVDENTLVVVDVKKFLLGSDPEELCSDVVFPVSREKRVGGYGHDIWHLTYIDSCIPSATLFSRSLFQELGGFDGNTITSDWDYFIEACLYANVVHVQETLCFVGVWDGSLTETMTGTPYFFPRESLYTKFRVLRCKKLSWPHRARMMFMITRAFVWQGLRPFKHPLNGTYWIGFFEYIRYHFKWIFLRRDRFGDRPLDP